MVHHPLRAFAKERRGWVDEDHLVVDLGLVTFSGVLAGNVVKEASGDSLSDLSVVFGV